MKPDTAGSELECAKGPLVPTQGITLRGAALTAGFSLVTMSVAAPFADKFAYPRLVIAGNINQTVQNIATHHGLFLAAIGGYLVNYICDIVLAWALYVLLAPVNRALSLLAAWFRLIYTAIALAAAFNLVTVYNLIDSPYNMTVFGTAPLHAQVKLLLDSYRSTWGMALVLFGIYLVLLGYLVYRSGYIPKLLGILLVINGAGWFVNSLGPYLFPSFNFSFLFASFFGELILMVWLLVRGWKLREPIIRN